VCTTLLATFFLPGLPTPASAPQNAGGLISNGSFQGGGDNSVPGWTAYNSGYVVDRAVRRSGEQSIRCDSTNPKGQYGAFTRIAMNQSRPLPVRVTGWSKANNVGGSKNADYSIFIDVIYADNSMLYAQTAAFRTGTHDWERRQVLVTPTQPIKFLTVYAMFRNHAGTVWFDDFSAQELSGTGSFDSLALPRLTRSHAAAGGPLSLRSKDGLALSFDGQGGLTKVQAGGKDISSNAAGGFFVRDVDAGDTLVPLRGTAKRSDNDGVNVSGTLGAQGLRFTATVRPQGDTLAVDGEITDTTNKDRAVTVYFALPVNAEGWRWGQSIRTAETIQSGHEYSNLSQVNVGATGGLSSYPFACISNSERGVGIGGPMDWPVVYRIFYNGTTRQFLMAWDFALTGKVAAWPHNARFRCQLFALPPGQAEWGFRAAAQRFQQLNPSAYVRRAKADGIWLPFTDPTTIQNPSDFGFAFHEGDVSVKADHGLGILCFRYTEPLMYFLIMPRNVPNTYENAVSQLKKDADGPPGEKRDFARLVLECGSQDENGHFNVDLRNESYGYGAMFLLNPSLSSTPDSSANVSRAFSAAMAAKRYGNSPAVPSGDPDGEYIDDFNTWDAMQDYRASNLQGSPYPLPYDAGTHNPVMPQWYVNHAILQYVSSRLHGQGKLVMANGAPDRISVLTAFLDVMGHEVHWADSKDQWSPASDATLSRERTLCAQKPYCMLMNVNFDKFPSSYVEKYFQRSLFYGMFPSNNGLTVNYWNDPKLYNRDRALFKKYIPVIKRLSAAGWEPITDARSANAAVFVERFGPRLFTVYNGTGGAQSTTLNIDLSALGLSAADSHITDLLTNRAVAARVNGNTLAVPLRVGAEEVQALELK
jgi:hypothetical protein